MKKILDIKKISNKVDINIDDYSSKKLEQKEIGNENLLYEVLKNQYNDWKNITMITLEQSNNKSILLYLMFITVEIYIKAECVRYFMIKKLNQDIPYVTFNNFRRPFRVSRISHKVNDILNDISDSKDNDLLLNFDNLIKIRRELEKLKVDKIINDKYTDLRYNCGNNTNFLFPKEENIISNEEKEKIKEVLKYVM